MNTTGLFSAYAKPVICWNYRPLTSYCKAMILNKKRTWKRSFKTIHICNKFIIIVLRSSKLSDNIKVKKHSFHSLIYPFPESFIGKFSRLSNSY